MGCLCNGGAVGDFFLEEEADKDNRGPVDNRGCTDVHCLLLYILYLLGLLGLLILINKVSDVRFLTHGVDHYKSLCGVDEHGQMLKAKRYTYFPDLHTDFTKDPSLRSRYGICVDECPAANTFVLDYGDDIRPYADSGSARTRWEVVLPSFAIAGRCVPYSPPVGKNETLMCAFPSCDPPSTGPITTATQVCGLARDGTDRYWLLNKPDEFIKWGWGQEGKTPEEVIRLVDIATKAGDNKKLADTCEVTATRSVSVKLKHNAPIFNLLLAWNGWAYRHGTAVYDYKWTIVGIGLGGALVASFLVILLFAMCAQVIVAVLTVFLFFILGVVDYILFVQAKWATGRTGLAVLASFQNMTKGMHIDTGALTGSFGQKIVKMQNRSDETLIKIYGFLAVSILVLIVVLFIIVCASRKNFMILIGLLNEAARTIREMPTLLVFPFFNLFSVLISAAFCTSLLVGTATMKSVLVLDLLSEKASFLTPLFEDPKGFDHGAGESTQFEQTQGYMMWGIVFGFLWVYYFHVAFFTCVVSGAISHWYFYRDDPERNAGTGIHSKGYYPGRPIIISSGRVFRYHLGSLAKGSFIMALATLPRIILEYIDQQTKGAQETNPVITLVIKVARCLLCCLQKCLQFMTEYAYCNVMITGKPFCVSARQSFNTFLSYPVQVAMDKMASTALGYVACVTVPAFMGVITYLIACKTREWISVCGMVVILAFVTTRLAVGVYDVTITTLFLCLMRDCKHFGGQYMTPELSTATGLPTQEDRDQYDRKSHGGAGGQLHDETEMACREG